MKTQLTLIMILITSLFLAACAPALAPTAPIGDSSSAAPLSPTLTYTLVSSATPTVTATPPPTATPTLEPTITPTPMPLLEFEKNMTLQDLVDIFYRTGDFELLVNLLDALTSYYQTTPVPLSKIYALMGDAYSHQGDYKSAAIAYNKAMEKFHDFKQINGDLCHVYGLLEDPEKALPYCELASVANPDYFTYLDRGKVYAGLGYWKAAIQDFGMVAKQLKNATGANEIELVQQLNGWIKELEFGENPITSQVLAEERELEMAHAMPTQTIEEQAAPSGKDLQETAAQFGFGSFKISEIKDPFQENSLPFMEASVNFGACQSTLAFQADDNMIYKIMMIMRGCSQSVEYTMGIQLIDQFFPGKEDKAKSLIWLFKQANAVIEVEEAEAEIATIRKCNLNATYNRTDESTVLLFSCH